MRRRMMKSKIHRATVTDADLHYVGSVTVDRDLMDAADLCEYEQVAVVDIDNGARLETYVIEGARGSGDVCLNGAAARLVSPGDRVILISYADYEEAELAAYAPTVVHVDTANAIVDEATASALAALHRPAPRRYVEVPAHRLTDATGSGPAVPPLIPDPPWWAGGAGVSTDPSRGRAGGEELVVTTLTTPGTATTRRPPTVPRT